ncbi:hypothetical protein Scep_022159 [Stephania cephalantha]|uniref:Uncharacterized protein n=1 Tax=Stephania cephalantha TaxID=152367 RepID=A0AAP0I215_9MAGN
MANDEEIFGLMHKCSLSMEEEDEVVITEEQTKETDEQGKLSLIGELAII